MRNPINLDGLSSRLNDVLAELPADIVTKDDILPRLNVVGRRGRIHCCYNAYVEGEWNVIVQRDNPKSQMLRNIPTTAASSCLRYVIPSDGKGKRMIDTEYTFYIYKSNEEAKKMSLNV